MLYSTSDAAEGSVFCIFCSVSLVLNVSVWRSLFPQRPPYENQRQGIKPTKPSLALRVSLKWLFHF